MVKAYENTHLLMILTQQLPFYDAKYCFSVYFLQVIAFQAAFLRLKPVLRVRLALFA